MGEVSERSKTREEGEEMAKLPAEGAGRKGGGGVRAERGEGG